VATKVAENGVQAVYRGGWEGGAEVLVAGSHAEVFVAWKLGYGVNIRVSSC